MNFEVIFFVLFLVVVGSFVWRFIAAGSLTGALLGGKVSKEIGVISLVGGTFSSQTLKVMTMQSRDGEQFIALSVVSKAPLAASMVPFKLTKPQAQELIRLLQQSTAA